MNYHVTIRFGKKLKGYHSFSVEAEDAISALRAAPELIPSEMVPEVDLIELREAPDFEKSMHQEEGE
jgi:hypothetical protein